MGTLFDKLSERISIAVLSGDNEGERQKLEKLLHRVFEPARLDIEINDRFGNPVKPREWFLVPLFVIDEVVEKIKDSSITDFKYDHKSAKLVKI